MFDSVFVPKSQLQERVKSKNILLPAKFKMSRYSVQTKPCKYYELGCCRYGKKCRFFHDPHGPRTFVSEEEFSKKILVELDRKFEEIHTNIKRILNDQSLEITNLRSLLIERLDKITLPEVAESTITDTSSNISNPKTNQVPMIDDKICGHCGKSAKMRCSKCQTVYYCTPEHQLAHWKKHKKLCSLIADDPQENIKDFDTCLDTDAEILDVKIKKTSKTLGIVLQSDELEKVVFISDIVNNSVSVLKEGDQILQINNQNIDSVQGITHITGQADIGSEIEFKIKRPKIFKK